MLNALFLLWCQIDAARMEVIDWHGYMVSSGTKSGPCLVQDIVAVPNEECLFLSCFTDNLTFSHVTDSLNNTALVLESHRTVLRA